MTENLTIRPLGDKVLVKRSDAIKKSTGGIIIPDNAKEKPIEGVIIAVGKGSRDIHGNVNALDVKAGDKVLFSKYGITEVKITGEENLIIIKECDILGVINESVE